MGGARVTAAMTGPHPFLGDLLLDRVPPHELLARLVDTLHSTRTIDEQLCRRISAGNLESLLREHEDHLWLEVERLARADLRFRRALDTVIAANSPMFRARCDLLEELAARPRRSSRQRSKRERAR